PIMLPFFLLLFFSSSPHHLVLHSFPTRRSSDLGYVRAVLPASSPLSQLRNCGGSPAGSRLPAQFAVHRRRDPLPAAIAAARERVDRKSTRLNSSHSQISYAVFCLKKKKKKKK